MTNENDGSTWTEGDPLNSEPRNLGAQEIRGLRKGVRIRLEKEHTILSGGSPPADGGEHKKGSGRAYYQTDGDPTTRPDGTALDSSDDGRLFVDSALNVLKVFDGTDFVNTAGLQIATGNFPSSDVVSTPQELDCGFDADIFILTIVSSGGRSRTFVVTLRDNLTWTDQINGGNTIFTILGFARVDNIVTVTYVSSNPGLISTTAQWMAIRFN